MSTKRKAVLAAANAATNEVETPPSKRRKMLPVSALYFNDVPDGVVDVDV